MNLKPLDPVEFLVLHCSATNADHDVTLADIDLWHRQRGWLACGYHIVIRRDGAVEFGRPLDRMGAHVRGYNHMSIGICMVGGVDHEGTPEDNFTEAQFANVRVVLEMLRGLYPNADTVGHYQLDSGKACPSFDPAEKGLVN